MADTTFGFIGFGLIGGSIAKSIRRSCPEARIMAYMRSRSKLEQAKPVSYTHLTQSRSLKLTVFLPRPLASIMAGRCV